MPAAHRYENDEMFECHPVYVEQENDTLWTKTIGGVMLAASTTALLVVLLYSLFDANSETGRFGDIPSYVLRVPSHKFVGFTPVNSSLAADNATYTQYDITTTAATDTPTTVSPYYYVVALLVVSFVRYGTQLCATKAAVHIHTIETAVSSSIMLFLVLLTGGVLSDLSAVPFIVLINVYIQCSGRMVQIDDAKGGSMARAPLFPKGRKHFKNWVYPHSWLFRFMPVLHSIALWVLLTYQLYYNASDECDAPCEQRALAPHSIFYVSAIVHVGLTGFRYGVYHARVDKSDMDKRAKSTAEFFYKHVNHWEELGWLVHKVVTTVAVLAMTSPG